MRCVESKIKKIDIRKRAGREKKKDKEQKRKERAGDRATWRRFGGTKFSVAFRREAGELVARRGDGLSSWRAAAVR